MSNDATARTSPADESDEQTLPPRPAPHPEPPPDLARYPLPIREVEPPWFRSHRADLAPIYVGRDPAHGRFNDPFREYGVLYLGNDEFTAFIETFGTTRSKGGPYLLDNVITEEEVAARCLCEIRSCRHSWSLTLLPAKGWHDSGPMPGWAPVNGHYPNAGRAHSGNTRRAPTACSFGPDTIQPDCALPSSIASAMPFSPIARPTS
jgi:hypothetical protein